MSATDKFKLILGNMKQEEVLNFIWIYDQYVTTLDEQRSEEEDWNVFTLNIEDFYHKVYKKEFRKQNAPRIPTKPGVSGTPLTK